MYINKQADQVTKEGIIVFIIYNIWKYIYNTIEKIIDFIELQILAFDIFLDNLVYDMLEVYNTVITFLDIWKYHIVVGIIGIIFIAMIFYIFKVKIEEDKELSCY